MCGRYVSPDEASIEREFNLVRSEWQFPPSYNVAPTDDVPVIRVDKEGKRAGASLHWGLIPYWAKDPKIAYRTINARAESIDTAPSFQQAFKKRRCLIPADSFYEWKKVVGGKIPYAIGMKDDSPFVFAGLWEGWKDPATDEWLRTCTIITGEPNELVAQIHTRMPIILPEEDHAKWLGEAQDGRFEGFAEALSSRPDADLGN